MLTRSDCVTPCYVFDEAAIARRVELLRRALPDGIRICYAMKANSFVLEAASRSVDYVEACSPGELATCSAVGVPEDKWVVSGIYKDPDVMANLIANHKGIHRFTVESAAQLELLAALAQHAERPVPLLMRLTSGNQFGIDVDQIRSLISCVSGDPHVDVCGIQFFSGTQKSSPSRLRREIGMLDAVIAELSESCGVCLRELEYGPGLPISYCRDEGEQELLEPKLLHTLASALEEMSFSGTKTLEIGRSLVASCGTYYTSVVDVKCNRGQRYAVVDGGKHQIAYYGPALALKPPAFHVISDHAPGPRDSWAICGSLCTTTDLLVKQADLPALHIGDRIAFHNAGAYCPTEALALFLSRDLPRVYVRGESGVTRLVRPRIETSRLNTPMSCWDKDALQGERKNDGLQ